MNSGGKESSLKLFLQGEGETTRDGITSAMNRLEGELESMSMKVLS